MSSLMITLGRLPDVPTDELRALLNEPRNARHMPLVGEPFTADSARMWAESKDAQWSTNGYGPWAIWTGTVFAGWGGFQREESGPDFALVLCPAHRGAGRAIAVNLITVGMRDLGIDEFTIALPLSRSDPSRALARLGFRPAGHVEFDGVSFRQFRLHSRDWRGIAIADQ